MTVELGKLTLAKPLQRLTEKQKAVCAKCSFLSPECYLSDGTIDCIGDKDRALFIRVNGFTPLPFNERIVIIDSHSE